MAASLAIALLAGAVFLLALIAESNLLGFIAIGLGGVSLGRIILQGKRRSLGEGSKDLRVAELEEALLQASQEIQRLREMEEFDRKLLEGGAESRLRDLERELDRANQEIARLRSSAADA